MGEGGGEVDGVENFAFSNREQWILAVLDSEFFR